MVTGVCHTTAGWAFAVVTKMPAMNARGIAILIIFAGSVAARVRATASVVMGAFCLFMILLCCCDLLQTSSRIAFRRVAVRKIGQISRALCGGDGSAEEFVGV